VAGYLLFFPVAEGNPGPDLQHFTAAGLKSLWHPDWAHMPVIGPGPNGTRGVVYTPRGRVGYFPAEQTWQDWGGVWFGRWTDKPLAAADLERHQPVFGLPTKLAVGGEWLVPVAAQMPHAMHHDGQQWVRRVKDEYREYWEQAVAFYGLWRAAKESLDAEGAVELEFTWERAADFAVLGLGFNYYLTPRIAGALGLFDDQALVAVQLAAIQGGLIAEVDAQKKTEPADTPATSASSSGPGA
jgi:hypothetical protein